MYSKSNRIVIEFGVRRSVFVTLSTLTSVQYLEGHLKFLAFFLQEASLYLVWNRAKEVWECLVSGMDVCELDREVNSKDRPLFISEVG